MSKLDLLENEKLLGEQQASHIKKFLFMPQANPGKLYITDKRIVFKATQGRVSSEFENSLEDIESFSVGIANTITIKLKNGETHKITGMFNKKLISALEKAKVKKN